MTRYWCELAWLGGSEPDAAVVIDTDGDRIASVDPTAAGPPDGCVRLAGITLPGLANAHSHAFHRALRGHTQTGTGSFWTWRDQMYAVAAALDPDRYRCLARAVFAEMVLAGITVVGEFHYVHHRPDGEPYPDPNAMGRALVEAAAEAGLRMTLLDTCYLHGGIGPSGHLPLSPEQRRFGDGDAARWAERVDALEEGPALRIGAAAHSVRAVDPDAIESVASWAQQRGRVFHIHLSEQPAENEQCRSRYGTSPAGLLDSTGALTPTTTAVHATHLTDADIEMLGSAGCSCCFCPTTERDLADGIGPSQRLARAGASLCLGSDSHAVVDLLEEARALELDGRLASLERGGHQPSELLGFATEAGYRSLGWPEGGRLEPGALADFTTVVLDSPRTAGSSPESALATTVFAATATEIDHVVVGGETLVRDGRHTRIDVSAELAAAIGEVRP